MSELNTQPDTPDNPPAGAAAKRERRTTRQAVRRETGAAHAWSVEPAVAGDGPAALPAVLLDRIDELRKQHERVNAERCRLAQPAEDDHAAIEAMREELAVLMKTRAKLELRGKRDELAAWSKANGPHVADLRRELSATAELVEANAIARRDVLRERLAELDREQSEIEAELDATITGYADFEMESLRAQQAALGAAASRLSSLLVALGRLGRQSEHGTAQAPLVLTRAAQLFRSQGFGLLVDEQRAREITARFSAQLGKQFLRT
jgi:hypothetical protein